MKFFNIISMIATFITFFAFLGSVGAMETGLISLRAGTIHSSLFLAMFSLCLIFASKGVLEDER